MSDSTLNPSDYQPPAELGRVQSIALVVGAVGLALSVLGYFSDQEQFFRSYLVGWVYWVVIAAGCLGWSMVQHLTGGTWGLVLRRVLEAGSRTIPIFAILFLPFWIGMEHVWEWARPEAAEDHLVQLKAGFLNKGFFWVRFLIYFAIWTGLAFMLSSNSRKQDETGDPKVTVRMRTISGPGIVIFVLVTTAASWDWLMSLLPHWYSSLYGFYFVSSTALASLVFLIVCAWWLHTREPLSGLFRAKYFHDYGKLTLALTMFWAYMTLSQFLITWSGNVPEFTIWYEARNTGGWKLFTIPLVIFHFFVPFLILLSAKLKQQPSRLVLVAFYMLAMRWVDLYWQAAPTWHENLTVHWLDFATLAGVGGIFVFFFIRELRSRTIVPVKDPYLKEVIGHG